jgi:hypothetical protein
VSLAAFTIRELTISQSGVVERMSVVIYRKFTAPFVLCGNVGVIQRACGSTGVWAASVQPLCGYRLKIMR